MVLLLQYLNKFEKLPKSCTKVLKTELNFFINYNYKLNNLKAQKKNIYPAPDELPHKGILSLSSLYQLAERKPQLIIQITKHISLMCN